MGYVVLRDLRSYSTRGGGREGEQVVGGLRKEGRKEGMKSKGTREREKCVANINVVSGKVPCSVLPVCV